MYTVVIDDAKSKGVRYQFITEDCDTLESANRAARRAWRRNQKKDVYLFDEKGHLATDGFDSRELRNFYIVVTNKETGEDRVLARRRAMLFEMNEQAAWMWSILKKHEKRRYRILVQGELNGEQGYDSEASKGLKSNERSEL